MVDVKRVLSLAALREVSMQSRLDKPLSSTAERSADRKRTHAEVVAELSLTSQGQQQRSARSVRMPLPEPAWNYTMFQYGTLASAAGLAQLQAVRAYRRCADIAAKSDSSFDQLV